MNDEVQMYLDDAEETMKKAVLHLETELVKLRAGKANPHMLNCVYIDYYGVHTPLSQVANIGTQDAITIVIQPYEKSKAMIDAIEKEILKANLGFNPSNNGEVIRINVPVLTEERRKGLVKQAKVDGENNKIVIRNIRRDTIEELKKMLKTGLSEDEEKDAIDYTQKLTDTFIKKIDQIIEAKEKDIMTV